MTSPLSVGVYQCGAREEYRTTRQHSHLDVTLQYPYTICPTLIHARILYPPYNNQGWTQGWVHEAHKDKGYDHNVLRKLIYSGEEHKKSLYNGGKKEYIHCTL